MPSASSSRSDLRRVSRIRRRPGPSLYVAVCGRRDAVMPRNVQKDGEASLTWNLKDEILRRGKMYYAKLVRGRATFIAPRMIP